VALYLDFNVIGNLAGQKIIINVGNLGQQSTIGNNFIALAESPDHIFVLFGFFLLRTNQQEVENAKHQQQRQNQFQSTAPGFGFLRHRITYKETHFRLTFGFQFFDPGPSPETARIMSLGRASHKMETAYSGLIL
jgi:hypothetical protein